MLLETKTMGGDINILGSSHYTTRSCTVSDVGVVADAEGRKIVPKGSFLDIDGEIITDASVITPIGVLFMDVDVTYGSQAGAIIEHGIILKDRLPEAPTAEVETALKHILFR